MGMYDPSSDGPPQRSNGRNARLILAVILALIGIFTYMSRSEINPVTGEKQHISLTPDQEIQLGLDSAPEMARQMGGELPANDPRSQLVQQVGQMLVSKTRVAKSPWKFKFHVLADNQTINAFALPGGQIFITLGLLNKLQNEAQLAGVLSHEMGHVIERHGAEQMAQQELGQSLVIAIGTGTSDVGYDTTQIAQMVNQVIQLRYSRGDESEADLWGLKLMEEVGLDPREMIRVMEILKQASGGRGQGPDIFQTHPNPDLRIKQIEAYLQEHPPKGNLSKGKIYK